MRTKLLFLLSGVAIISLFFLLWSGIWNPQWNPFRPRPEIILARALSKIKNASSFHLDWELRKKEETKKRYDQDNYSLAYNDSLENKVSLDVVRYSLSDSDYRLVVNNKKDLYRKYYRGDIFEGSPYNSRSSRKLEIRKIGDYFYFINQEESKDKVEEGSLFNQWIRLRKDEIGDLIIFLFTQGEKLGFEMKISKEDQERLIKKINELLIKDNPLTIKEQLPDEKIEDRVCYHYLVSLDKEKTKLLISDILSEIASLLRKSISFSSEKNGATSSQEEIIYKNPSATLLLSDLIGMNLELQSAVDDFFEKLQGVDLEIWIDKKDGDFRRIKIDKSRDFKDFLSDSSYPFERKTIEKAIISFFFEADFIYPAEVDRIDPPDTFKELGDMIKETPKIIY